MQGALPRIVAWLASGKTQRAAALRAPLIV